MPHGTDLILAVDPIRNYYRRARATAARFDGVPMTKKTALIAGVTGQDGSMLAELLLEKG